MDRQNEVCQCSLYRMGRLGLVTGLAILLAAAWIIGVRKATNTLAAERSSEPSTRTFLSQASNATSIVVATDAGYWPMEYISGTQIVGHDIDLMNAIAAEISVTVVYSIVPWNGIFVGLVAGNYDAIINALTVTPEREDIIDFTLPYMAYEEEGHLAIAVQQGDNSLRCQINDALWKLRAKGILQTIITNIASDWPDVNARLPEWSYTSVATDTESTLVFTDTQGSLTTIQISGGAVTDTLDLLYIPVDTITVPFGYVFGNHAFEINAYLSGDILLPSITFSIPATITIHYTYTDVIGIDENSLLLWRWNEALNEWEDAACGLYERHPEENWLAVPICNLSRFAFFGEGFTIYLPLVTKTE